jgi:hypothetical protein
MEGDVTYFAPEKRVDRQSLWVGWLTYLVYIVFWEALCLGGAAYVVFVLHRSGWWFALALCLSECGIKPERWIYGVEE